MLCFAARKTGIYMNKDFLFLGEKGAGKEMFIDLLLGYPFLKYSPFEDPDFLTLIYSASDDGVFISDFQNPRQKRLLSRDVLSDLTHNEFISIDLKFHPLLLSGIRLWNSPPINTGNINSLIQLGSFLTANRSFNQIFYFLNGLPSQATIQFLKSQKQIMRDFLTVIINTSNNGGKSWDNKKISEIKNSIKANIGNIVIETLDCSELADWFNTHTMAYTSDQIFGSYKNHLLHPPSVRASFTDELKGMELFEEIEKLAGEGYSQLITSQMITRPNSEVETKPKKPASHNILDGYHSFFTAKTDSELRIAVNSILASETEDPDLKMLQAICLLTDTSVTENVQQALKILIEISAENALAAYYLGAFYENGMFVEEDLQRAFNFYRSAADLGDFLAMNIVGEFYLKGTGTRTNSEYAFNYFKHSASGSIPSAYRNLGLCYKNGIGCMTDANRAVEYLGMSAEAGDVIGQYELGLGYLEGIETIQNYEKGIEWLTLAAENGHAHAAYLLGYDYMAGNRLEQNPSKAFKYLRMAAECNDGEAFFYLAECYQDGIGIDQDYSEALLWYEIAAENGDFRALARIGIIYEYGLGVEKNIDLAYDHYFSAAQKGDPYGQFCLGYCYLSGTCTEQNYEEAVKWFRAAAEAGLSHAQNNLGACYEDGLGVAQNDTKAFENYLKAAHKDLPLGCRNVGRCYKEGIGTDRDDEKAFSYFMAAAEAGDPEGEFELSEFFAKGLGTEENINAAFMWCSRAAEHGYVQALAKLGFYYERGLGTNENSEMAFKH